MQVSLHALDFQPSGEDSGVRKVSLASCSLGEKYAIKLLPKLREQGISDAKVSVRPAPVIFLQFH
jgi:hypothetical protein